MEDRISREDAERELEALEGLLGDHLEVMVVGGKDTIWHIPGAYVFTAFVGGCYDSLVIRWAGKELLRQEFTPANLTAGDTLSLDARGILKPLLELIEMGALR